MNKKGQNLWEFVLLLAVIAGIFIWMDFKKTTQSNKFQDQSSQTNVANKKYALINEISFLNWHSTPKNPPTVSGTTVIPTSGVIISEPVVPDLGVSLGIPKDELASIGNISPTERLGLDIVIILVVIVLGGLLDAIGGDFFLAARRYIMPILIAAGISIITYTFHPVWYSWLSGLLVTPVMGTLCLGYSGSGNFGRALWLFLQSVVMGLFLVIATYFFHAHLLTWWLFIFYVITTGIWGGLYRNWEQFLGDWVTGSWLCSIIFYVFLSLQFSL